MNKILMTIAAVALALPCFLFAQKNAPVKVSVMSYNIRQSHVDDGPNHWNKRKAASIAMIDSLRPGVIGVQEAQDDQMEYLKANLPGYAAVGVGRDDGKRLGEYSPVFYRTDLYEPLAKGWFWLSETPDEVSRGWDAACNRMVTWVKLRDKASKHEFYVFDTHLDHQGDTARREGVKLIVDRAEKIAGGLPVFVTGDFNMRPADKRLEPMNTAFLSAKAKAPVTDDHQTVNGWSKENKGGTIDYIFYRGARPLTYRVVNDDFGVLFISDHYPIIAEFVLE